MKKSKIALSLYLIAAAIILLLCGTGLINGVPALKLTVPLMLLPFFISGILKLGFIRILFPVCFTVITFSNDLGLSHISPWLLIIAALFLAIGLNSLVPKSARIKRKIKKLYGIYNNSDPDNIKIQSRFGGIEKFIEAKCFTSAVIDCSMSGMELFFDKAQINPDGATIYIDAKFSGIELYIPKDWQVIDRLDCSMSGINIPITEEKTHKLILEGRVSFCGFDVKYKG